MKREMTKINRRLRLGPRKKDCWIFKCREGDKSSRRSASRRREGNSYSITINKDLECSNKNFYPGSNEIPHPLFVGFGMT